MNAEAKTATRITVEGGWLDGHIIRRARKSHHCDYWRGALNGGRCKSIIQAGTYYVEGDANDDAGGFGNDRYCGECAGEEARAAIAKAEGRAS